MNCSCSQSHLTSSLEGASDSILFSRQVARLLGLCSKTMTTHVVRDIKFEELFSTNPKKAVENRIKEGRLERDAAAVADLILRMPHLNDAAVGDYLGDGYVMHWPFDAVLRLGARNDKHCPSAGMNFAAKFSPFTSLVSILWDWDSMMPCANS